MSAKNSWNWEESPDESNASNHYRIDNVGLGLQVGLGLPVQLLHQSQAQSRVFHNQQRGSLRPHNASSYKQRPKYPTKLKEVEVEKTVDGIPIRTVYVKNIHSEVGYHEMFNIFMRYGKIVNMHVCFNKHSNNKKHAFVTFNCPTEASRVMKIGKFKDHAGRNMYTSAADSWHQPKENADGEIILPNQRGQDCVKENIEDDSEVTNSPLKKIQFVQEDGLNSLNDDCLMHIFSFLSWKQIAGVERVCKRWQGISYRMWRSLRELSMTQPPFDKLPQSKTVLEHCLKRCGESLTELQLNATPNSYHKATAAVIAKYCINIERLHLVDLCMGYRSLAHLGRQCTQLKKIVLDKCSKFNDGDLLSLLPKCKDLSHLELNNCNLITGQCLASVTGPVSNLVLTYCPKLNSNFLNDGLQKMTESLKELTVIGCGPVQSPQQLSVMINQVPNLSSLSLCEMTFLTRSLDNKGLSAIGSLLHLTYLDLNKNSIVNDHVIEPIVEGCQQLCTLNLSCSGRGPFMSLTEEGLSLIGRLKKLTSLDISYLLATTDKTLKNITTRNGKLKSLTCRGCPGITDEGSSQVVTVSNDLEMFDLSGCSQVGVPTVSAAHTSVKMRTNNVPLKLIVGGTGVTLDNCHVAGEVPQLSVDLANLSNEMLHPDFMDDIFFPYSDDDDDFDDDFDDDEADHDFLHHLIEGIDDHCHLFGFDDLHDPTLCDQYSCDSVIRFGEVEDNSDIDDASCSDNDYHDNDAEEVYQTEKEDSKVEDSKEESWD